MLELTQHDCRCFHLLVVVFLLARCGVVKLSRSGLFFGFIFLALNHTIARVMFVHYELQLDEITLPLKSFVLIVFGFRLEMLNRKLLLRRN